MSKLNYRVAHEDTTTFLYVEPDDNSWSMQLGSYFNQLHIIIDKEENDDHWEKIVDDDTLDDAEVERIHSSIPPWVSIELGTFYNSILYLINADTMNIVSMLKEKK